MSSPASCGPCTVYWWEPDALVGPDSRFVRLNFDDTVACQSGKTYAQYPNNTACDFAPGNLFKAISRDVDEMLRVRHARTAEISTHDASASL